MGKGTAKGRLKSFSVIYIILAVFYAIATIVVNNVPEVANQLKLGLGEYGLTILNTSAVVYVIVNLWYFWLARRVVNGYSQGTFYLVLLVIGVVSNIVSFFTSGISFLNIDAIVEIIALVLLLQVRKEG